MTQGTGPDGTIYSAEIAAILNEGGKGTFTAELYHRHGISQQSSDRWMAKSGELKTAI